MIRVEAPQNCSGCRLCALACSFWNAPGHAFSLAEASIRIDRVRNGNSFQPRILDDCTGCGSCLEFCDYGVLAEG